MSAESASAAFVWPRFPSEPRVSGKAESRATSWTPHRSLLSLVDKSKNKRQNAFQLSFAERVQNKGGNGNYRAPGRRRMRTMEKSVICNRKSRQIPNRRKQLIRVLSMSPEQQRSSSWPRNSRPITRRLLMTTSGQSLTRDNWVSCWPEYCAPSA